MLVRCRVLGIGVGLEEGRERRSGSYRGNEVRENLGMEKCFVQ